MPDDTPSHSIDREAYDQLPPDLKARFDAWLSSEDLWNRDIIAITVLEAGYIEAIRYKRDPTTDQILLKPIVGPERRVEFELEKITLPISSPPPREALT